MVQSLTIGVPVRNEEKSLPIFIKNLASAVERLRSGYPDLSVEVIFCINNTTDESEKVIRDLLPCSKLKNYQIIHCNSPGKFAALRKIARESKFPGGYICSIDADIILDQLCITGLVRQLEEDKNLFLVYSGVFPVTSASINFMERIQGTHYSLRRNISPRKYFHGRTYMMRSAILLKEEPRKLQTSYWDLEDGPYVDDVYLSRLIVHLYGADSIKESKYSKLWFIPPKNIKDFYFGQRRLLFEIKRLNLLYPEHSYVQKEVFRKKVRWSYFLNLKLKYFSFYLSYFLVEEIIRIIIRLEISLISLNLIKCKAIWKNLNSTKGALNGNK